jgi:hypothetical protein
MSPLTGSLVVSAYTLSRAQIHSWEPGAPPYTANEGEGAVGNGNSGVVVLA